MPEPVHHVREGVPGVGVGRVLPALAEHRVQRVHRRPANLQLDVVPGRAFTVGARHRECLRVAAVRGVVPPAVAEIDAAGEGDVPPGIVVVAEDDELLVVAAATAYPLVQDHLPAVLLDLPVQSPVLVRTERQRVDVRPPDEATHDDAAVQRTFEQLGHRRSVLAQPLVGIAPPVGEEQVVALVERIDLLDQPVEVGDAVEQRFREVAGRPRGQRCGGVAALLGREEPLLGVVHPMITTRSCRGRNHRCSAVRR